MSLPVNRRRLALALALLVLATSAVIVTLQLLGDGPSADRAQLSAASVQARSEFVAIATSEKSEPPPQVLLAPASEEWWPLVSGMAVELNLGSLDLPSGAAWIGYSINHAPDDFFAGRAYPAVYLGFATTQQALDFDPRENCSCIEYRRGSISMLTPASFEGSQLELPQWTDEKTPVLSVDEATWTWDIGAYRDLIASDAVHPNAVRKHFEVLGLGGDVSWEAVSSSPRGPWTGQLTGFDLDAVDTSLIAEAVDVDDEVVCEGGVCYSNANSIEVGNWEHASAGAWSFGTPDLSAPYVGLAAAPVDGSALDWADDRALIWTWNPAYWRGSITQSELSGSGPIETLHLEVAEDGRAAQLRVRFVDDPIAAAN